MNLKNATIIIQKNQHCFIFNAIFRAGLEGDRLLAQSSIFFVAGLETSAVTMSFALLELAQHPDIQARVYAEMAEKIGKQGLTYECISEMNYLQQVVSETLLLPHLFSIASLSMITRYL